MSPSPLSRSVSACPTCSPDRPASHPAALEAQPELPVARDLQVFLIARRGENQGPAPPATAAGSTAEPPAAPPTAGPSTQPLPPPLDRLTAAAACRRSSSACLCCRQGQWAWLQAGRVAGRQCCRQGHSPPAATHHVGSGSRGRGAGGGRAHVARPLSHLLRPRPSPPHRPPALAPQRRRPRPGGARLAAGRALRLRPGRRRGGAGGGEWLWRCCRALRLAGAPSRWSPPPPGLPGDLPSLPPPAPPAPLQALARLLRHFHSIPRMTYRSAFTTIPVGEVGLRSDAGWGCTLRRCVPRAVAGAVDLRAVSRPACVRGDAAAAPPAVASHPQRSPLPPVLRSGQMVLAQGLQRHHLGRDWRWPAPAAADASGGGGQAATEPPDPRLKNLLALFWDAPAGATCNRRARSECCCRRSACRCRCCSTTALSTSAAATHWAGCMQSATPSPSTTSACTAAAAAWCPGAGWVPGSCVAPWKPPRPQHRCVPCRLPTLLPLLPLLLCGCPAPAPSLSLR